MASTARRLVQLGKESIVYGFAGVAQKFIGVALIPLYTRIFSPSDYGVMALVNSMVALLTPLIVLGLDNSSARWFYDTQDLSHKRSIITSWFLAQATVGCVVAGTLLILSPYVATLMHGSRQHLLIVCLALGTIPLTTPVKVLGNLLRYQRRAWTSSIFSLTTSLATVSLAIWLVLIRRSGMPGVYIATLIGAGLAAVAAMYMLRDWISIKFFSWKRLREMAKFGLPLVPAAIAYWLSTSSDRFILGLFRSESEIGLYSLAASMASVVGLAIGAFQMAFGPFAFSIHKEKGSVHVYAKALDVYAWGGCLLCTGLSLFAPMLLRVFTTEQYLPAATCVPFLCFSYLLVGARDIASMGAAIAKRSVPVAVSILVAAAVSVMLNFFLDPHLGKEGAGIASMSAGIVSVAYLFYASQRLYRIPYRFGPAFGCFVLAWVLIIIDRLSPISSGVAAFGLRMAMCGAFIPFAFLLGIVRISDLRRVFSVWKARKDKG